MHSFRFEIAKINIANIEINGTNEDDGDERRRSTMVNGARQSPSRRFPSKYPANRCINSLNILSVYWIGYENTKMQSFQLDQA